MLFRSLLAAPFFHGIRRPRGTFVLMASGASIGGLRCAIKIRSRDAEAVIASLIVAHISPRGHMARRTLGPGAIGFVAVMGWNIKNRRGVALTADGVAACLQLGRMRVMAIAAGDALCMHAALQEGRVLIVFFKDLTVGIIIRRFQKRRLKLVKKRLSWIPNIDQHAAPGMTGRADVQFAAPTNLACVMRGGLASASHPAALAPIIQEADDVIFKRGRFLPFSLMVGDMGRSRAMTTFTTQRLLGPPGMEPIGGGIVIFRQRR